MKEFKGKRIVIVGGAGFVGSNLVRKLLGYGPRSIMIIDNLLSAERENLPDDSRIFFIKGSIASDDILRKVKDNIDYLFHLATYHGNQSSICNPLVDHENNTLTTLKLFERIKSFRNIKKVVYSSAGCTVARKTFGNTRPTTEDEPIEIDPDSPYSISKIIGEFYAVYYHKQHQLPVVRARFQNVYGPGEILGAGRWRGTPATVWRNVTPTFIYRAINKMPLPVENKGLASRDFIYVDDICSGLIACAVKGQPGDVYNLASGRETAILELAKTINKLTSNPAGIENRPKRSWDHSGRRFGSTVKSQRKLGFKARTNLHDGLVRTIAWTGQNMKLIQKCMDKHKRHLK
ncbi:MAG: NAD-dependent epimerase/dehydratase family protein [Candidatus Brocadiia bacterium]